eukprot:COSAG02_NODE_8494_length_2550_cov_2.567523_2_plen_436_part_00
MEPAGDRECLLRDGFVILRGVIPQHLLDELRVAHDRLVETQARLTGVTSADVGRTVIVDELAASIDESTAACVEYWTHESFHVVSSKLLGVEDAAVADMHMLCGEEKPLEEQSVGIWHRDFYPQRCAPLDSYANDIKETGPRYIQWNLSLYDDEVLWVVPGSHVRRASTEEDACLRSGGIASGRGAFREPLPGALHVRLKAGDGVAYSSPAILHWGSRYGSCKRRTLHGGYCVPGFGYSRTAPFLPLLSPFAQACFRRWQERHARQVRAEELVLRSALKPQAGVEAREKFNALVDELVPGRGIASRAHSLVLLSKAARRIFYYHHQHLISQPDPQQQPPQELHNNEDALCTAPNGYLQPGPVLYDRFTAWEAKELWRRFEHIDQALQMPSPSAGGLNWEPGFQGGLSVYTFHNVPPIEDLEPWLATLAERHGPRL